MISIQRTDSSNIYFIELVAKLDAELANNYDNHDEFYAQYNKIDHIKYVAVAFDGDVAVACGAMKQLDEYNMEIKRMYTDIHHRGKGFASKILLSLEEWVKELSFQHTVLETGIHQHSALALYKKSGYERIENYGQYAGAAESICFKKIL